MKLKTALLSLFWVWTQSLNAAPGYWKLADPKIPKAVRKSAESVFRLVPRTEKPTEYHTKVMDVLLNDPDHFSRAQYQAAKKKAGGATLIPTHFVSYGSAFLLGDNQTLISARHTWDSVFWDLWREELGKIENQETRLDTLVQKVIDSRLNFDLYDKDGNLIFSPEKGDHGKLQFILNYRMFEELQGRSVTTTAEMEALNDQSFDFIAIRLSRPLDKHVALELTKTGAEKGSLLYGLGYPGNYDSNYQRATNADGKTLWVSHGQPLSSSEGARAYKMGPLKADAANSLFADRVLFLDAEASPGISGGPVVDADGHVVSLVSAGLWDGAPGEKPFTSVPSPLLFKVGTKRFKEMFEFE